MKGGSYLSYDFLHFAEFGGAVWCLYANRLLRRGKRFAYLWHLLYQPCEEKAKGFCAVIVTSWIVSVPRLREGNSPVEEPPGSAERTKSFMVSASFREAVALKLPQGQ